MLVKSMLNTSPFDIAHEMDRLFDSLVSSQPAVFMPLGGTRWAFPALNLWEDEGSIYAEAELPGMKMDDIEVLVTEDELTVRGTRSFTAPEGARALRRERVLGSFDRTISLPVQIDTEHVEARFCDGVLSIRLPKAAAFQPRRIEVKTGKTS